MIKSKAVMILKHLLTYAPWGFYFSLLISLLKLSMSLQCSYTQADSGMAEAARPYCSFSSVKSLGEEVLSFDAPPLVKQEAGLLVAFFQ